jgi:hypothetical protein
VGLGSWRAGFGVGGGRMSLKAHDVERIDGLLKHAGEVWPDSESRCGGCSELLVILETMWTAMKEALK